MPKEDFQFLGLATFVALWLFIYLYFRMRRLRQYLDDRYWLLGSPTL